MKNNEAFLDSELEFVPCALCAKDDSDVIFSEKNFNVVRCRKCGLVYINPRPKQNKVRAGLNEESKAFEIDVNHYIQLEPLSIAKDRFLIQMIQKHCLKAGRILDVGCASGSFLRVARDFGFEAWGVEISPALAGYAHRSGLNVFCGTIKDAAFPDEFFDAVTLINVLSYFTDPINDLRQIRRILKKDGFFILENGNRGALNSRDFVERWGDSWFIPYHPIHYTEDTLKLLLQKAGFQTVELKQYCIVPSLLLKSVLRKIVSNQATADNAEAAGVSGQKLTSAFAKTYAILDVISTYRMGKLLPASNLVSTIIAFSR
jgi:SAM-dependent methyltransferase